MPNNNPMTSTGYRPGDIIEIRLKYIDGPRWEASIRGPVASDGGPFMSNLLVRGGSPAEALNEALSIIEASTNNPQ